RDFSAPRQAPLPTRTDRVDPVCGHDQREVGEGLREVADLPAQLGLVLLREQAQVVAEADQALEQRLRLVDPPSEGGGVGEPEAAGEECPFVPLATRRRRIPSRTGARIRRAGVLSRSRLPCRPSVDPGRTETRSGG